MSLILNTDSYKFSHFKQYPPDAENVFSYIEARGGEYDKTLFFGLQYFIKKYLTEQVTREQVDEARDIAEKHGVPFNESGWLKVVQVYNGFLPLIIKAVPEGSVITTGNILVSVSLSDDDPDMVWLVSYIETALLRAVWYPTTVATLSYYVKQDLLKFNKKSSDLLSEEAALFKLHDFGCRGVSSLESAAIGGLAHLVNFLGTDTIPALVLARDYYYCDMAGFSIPAAEHSTMTSWGDDGEILAYRNMLDEFAKPGQLVAVVSDSYDINNATDNIWGHVLKQKVIDSGATVIVRPDSGDPINVPIGVIKSLMKTYGYTTNTKGYKVLPRCIRVIQGDGLTPSTIKVFLSKLEQERISLDNIAFGMGGGLLQQVNRDTCKFAMKASAIKRSGKWRGISKSPIHDMGKASKSGILGLFSSSDGEYYTMEYSDNTNELKRVYGAGQIFANDTLDVIRERSNK